MTVGGMGFIPERLLMMMMMMMIKALSQPSGDDEGAAAELGRHPWLTHLQLTACSLPGQRAGAEGLLVALMPCASTLGGRGAELRLTTDGERHPWMDLADIADRTGVRLIPTLAAVLPHNTTLRSVDVECQPSEQLLLAKALAANSGLRRLRLSFRRPAVQATSTRVRPYTQSMYDTSMPIARELGTALKVLRRQM